MTIDPAGAMDLDQAMYVERTEGGYRVYYAKRGTWYILLLAGGSKSTQDSDIAEAKRLAAEYEE